MAEPTGFGCLAFFSTNALCPLFSIKKLRSSPDPRQPILTRRVPSFNVFQSFVPPCWGSSAPPSILVHRMNHTAEIAWTGFH